jgi:ribosomal protein L11 methyltransferase
VNDIAPVYRIQYEHGADPIEVAANLIAGVLVPLAGPLRDELRPGGILVASGIFVDRETEVRAAFEAAGLEVDGRLDEGEWVALEAHRPA